MTNLLTSSEAAAQLGISQSTLARYEKTGKLKPTSRTPTGQKRYSTDQLQKYQSKIAPDPTQSVSRLAPGGGSWIVSPVAQYSGRYVGGKNFYVPSDLAIRTNREDSRRMWNNLTIREALQSRLWAGAEQAGHVEPEDKRDKRQLQVATEIQKVIDNIPDFLKLKYCLLKSRFFGCYGVQLQYRYQRGKLAVNTWSPVHGDSIIFKQDSDDIGIYTAIAGGPGVKAVTTEAGYIGRAHVVEDGREVYFDERGMPYQKVGFNERQAFILMSYDPDPSDFLDPRGAGGVKGLGIRSTIYPTWYASQEILGNLVEWVERVGTGMTLYKFIRGDQSSYNSAKELAESNSNQAVILVPVDPNMNGGKPIEGVERIEPSAVGLDNMVKIIEDIFNSQIRRFIVGQDSTSKPANMGLGSKIAEVHESTFSRIVAFDCQDLAQCLTSQLVSVIQEWNHPDALDFKCKYIVDVDSSDVDKQMKAIKDAYEIGVSFDEDEIRGLTGCSKPDTESVILKKSGAEDKAEGQAKPTEGEGINEQAEAAATGELAQTVGGLTAISALQQSYYEGKIPQEACIANVVLLFGFTQEQAASLFPEIPPEKLTEDQSGMPEAASGAVPEEAPPEDEGLELFQYAWSPYQGPHGGKGWINDKGDVVYGDKPGGGKEDKGGGSPPGGKEDRAGGASPGESGSSARGDTGIHGGGGESDKAATKEKSVGKLRQLGKQSIKAVLQGKNWVSHKEHVIAEYTSNKVDQNVSKLPPKTQAVVRGFWAAVRVATKVAFASYTAGQALAENVARERGMTPEGAKALRNTLVGLDLAGAKGTTIGMSAIGLPGVGTVGSFLPAASLGYLSYSFARNPIKTVRAAKNLIKDTWKNRGKKPAIEEETKTVKHAKEENGKHLVEALADYIEAHPGDWAQAVLAAAIDETGNLIDGIALAEEALLANPEPPEGEEESPEDETEQFAAHQDADVALLAVAEILSTEGVSDDEKRGAIHSVLYKEGE